MKLSETGLVNLLHRSLRARLVQLRLTATEQDNVGNWIVSKSISGPFLANHERKLNRESDEKAMEALRWTRGKRRRGNGALPHQAEASPAGTQAQPTQDSSSACPSRWPLVAQPFLSHISGWGTRNRVIDKLINMRKCNHQEIPFPAVCSVSVSGSPWEELTESEWGKPKCLNLFLPTNWEMPKLSNAISKNH